MPFERRPLKSRSLAVIQNLAKTLAGRGVSPNQISVAGVGAAVLGFVSLWGAARGWPFWAFFLVVAAVCVQVRLLCNVLDGLVAVEFDRREKGGDLFNEVPDRIEDTLLLVGAGYVAGQVELGWMCAVLAVFTAYIRTLGASLGQAQDYSGPCAKPERMFILTVGLLLTVVFGLFGIGGNILSFTLWIIAIGTAVTAALRLRRLYRILP